MPRPVAFFVAVISVALAFSACPVASQAGLILFMSPSSTAAAPGSSGFFDLKIQLTDGESPLEVSGVSIQLDLTPQVTSNSGITFTENTFPLRENLFSEDHTFRFLSNDDKTIGISMYLPGKDETAILTDGASLTTIGFQVASGTTGVFDVTFNNVNSLVTLAGDGERFFDNPGSTSDIKLGELSSVPEPGTLLLTAMGIASGAWLTRRSRIRRYLSRNAS